MEIPNPDNPDEMPIFDQWGELDELVQNAAKRLEPGNYSILVTPDGSDEPGFLYGMGIMDELDENDNKVIDVQIRTNSGELVTTYHFGPIA
jgi:hypothetical protein